MTRDELIALLGHPDIRRDLDVKTLVIDLVRDRFTEDELMEIFWRYLPELQADYVRGYLYRKR